MRPVRQPHLLLGALALLLPNLCRADLNITYGGFVYLCTIKNPVAAIYLFVLSIAWALLAEGDTFGIYTAPPETVYSDDRRHS